MVKKNIKFIPTRPIEAHPHSRHPEERSDVRVLEQVGTVFGSQGPHGGKAPQDDVEKSGCVMSPHALQAQDDVSCFRHHEAHPHSRHPEERSDVRVSGQVGTVVGSQDPHGAEAPQDDVEKSLCVMRSSRPAGSGRRASGEQGRSMVEMLGTLAIMGVLSVGAVAGYRWAMDKYRAVQTISELNQRVVIYSSQLMTSGAFNESEFAPQTRFGYPVQGYLLEDDRYFEIALEQVPSGVCSALLKAEWQWPVYREANGIEYRDDTSICRADTDVRMSFIFPVDLSGRAVDFRQSCQTNADCQSSCGVCGSDGYCQSQCGTGETCARTYDNSSFYACCDNDSILNGMCCPTILAGQCCASNGSCCPADRPLLDKNGVCYACDTPNPVDVTNNTVMCGICDGEDGRQKRILNGNSCALPCPDETPLMDKDGNCHTCDEQVHIRVADERMCTSACDGTNTTIRMKRSWRKAQSYCEYPCADDEVTATSDEVPCVSCQEVSRINITYRDGTECTTKCDGSAPDRPKRRALQRWTGNNTWCVLDECPSDQPIQDAEGICHPCTDTNIDVQGVENNCFKCPNRALSGSKCIMADSCQEGTKYDSATQKCACEVDGQIMDNSGQCYDCTADQYLIDVTGYEDNCDKCKDTRLLKQFNAKFGCVKPCGDDEFYTGGGCQKCNDPTIYDMYLIGEYCLACDGQDGRAERVCVTAASCHSCALACSGNTTMAKDGTCHTCDEVDAFNVDWGMEASCTTFCAGQRYLVGKNCYKCPDGTYSPTSVACVTCPADKGTLTRAGDCIACGGNWDGDSCSAG